MGTRQLVKSGKLSVDEALTGFRAAQDSGVFVGDGILHWLERRKGVRKARQSSQQKKRKR